VAPSMKEWRMAFDSLRQGDGVASLQPVQTVRDWLRNTFGITSTQFRTELAGMADNIIQFLSFTGAAIAKHSMTFLLNLVIMIFTLFFVFRDGIKMSLVFQKYLPLHADVKAELVQNIHDTVVGILQGMFLTSFAQGLVAAIGYLIVGAPAVVLLGFLTALTGLIPSVGTALIWLPMAISYLLKDNYFEGIFLLSWGILVVGLIDNLLRPYLMRGKGEMPFLAMFFAILGGIHVWGFKGLVLGPLIIAIAPVLLHAYQRRFLQR
jgi:predicted PurR-regulated permease PerM